MTPVYLDYNATSPLRRTALRAMLPYLRAPLGNPSSSHRDGCGARVALDRSRITLAACLGAAPEELVFTSGGTESNNLALLGSLRPGELLVSAVEHPSVLKTAESLADPTHRVVLLPTDSCGVVQLGALKRALTEKTRMVSIQMVNHEVGAIQPIQEIAHCLNGTDILLHVDAVQAFGKLSIDLATLDIDLLSCTSHKIGGPVGIGALYVRRGIPLRPLLHGGSQERGRRAGTEATALAAGFAAAALEATQECAGVLARHRQLRGRLLKSVRDAFPNSVLNGPAEDRGLPGTINLSFPGARREALLVRLDLEGIRVSSGAACASGATETSPVLRAMCVSQERSASALRISMGPPTGEQEITRLIEGLVRSVPLARQKDCFF